MSSLLINLRLFCKVHEYLFVTYFLVKRNYMKEENNFLKLKIQIYIENKILNIKNVIFDIQLELTHFETIKFFYYS